MKELPQLPLLYSSRGGSLADFTQLSLPSNLSRFASAIIAAHHGEDVASTIIEQADQDFLNGLQSGFEIALLARVFILAGRTPQRRLEIYATLLEQAASAGFSETMDRTLSKCAWELWLKDDRNLGALNRLSADELNILADLNIAYVRGGSFVEFSHDQMRGYFAARWLAYHLGHIPLIRATLDLEDVWKPAPAVQSEMFSFLAEMLVSRWQSCDLTIIDLEQLGQYAVMNEKRFVLLRELSRAAGSSNISIGIQLGKAA
jgi:hypothetical protein